MNRDLLRRMTDTMSHRGPDDSGFYFDDAAGLGLGFRRLAIIDVSAAGHQPMCNEDESLWLVCNGEIYNFPALRPPLEARGHIFRSRTDTEVILHAYEERGAACVGDLDGMFALALWDRRERRLLLARDRLGEKPLYYYDDGGRLLFASELKALLAYPAVPRRLDWPAVGEFFAFGNVTGARCIMAGIRKLLPAHRLICSQGGAVTQRYWDWLPAFMQPDDRRSEAEWGEKIRAALSASVARRMISDVPLGAFLSGGVDSSAVVAAMAALGARPVKTFSIGFVEPRYNELDYAREVAKQFGTDHHELVVEPEGVRELLPQLVRQYDEPFADSSALPTYYLSKLARTQVTVCLSGDGGDEACAGYEHYGQALREHAVDRIPAALRRTLLAPIDRLPVGVPGRRLGRRLQLAAAQRYVSLLRQMPPEQVDSLLTAGARQRIGGDGDATLLEIWEEARGLDALSRMQYIDSRVYLPDDILVKVDRASMLCSLEVRCPLLDHHFLELMATVPPRLRRARGHGKHLFKSALRHVLPERVLQRPKMGFAVPLAAWLRGDLAAFAADLLLDQRSTARDIVSLPAVRQLLRVQAMRTQLAPHLWALVVFELWCRTYVDVA